MVEIEIDIRWLRRGGGGKDRKRNTPKYEEATDNHRNESSWNAICAGIIMNFSAFMYAISYTHIY